MKPSDVYSEYKERFERERAREIRSGWLSLSNQERFDLMSLCCRYCGTLNLPCRACQHAENDE